MATRVPSGQGAVSKVWGRPLKSLELSTRAYRIARNAISAKFGPFRFDSETETVGDLVQLTSDDIRLVRNCGPKTLYEIERALTDDGLRLKLK
jgi:DNA-directed RNA polymerase alpha subunit